MRHETFNHRHVGVNDGCMCPACATTESESVPQGDEIYHVRPFPVCDPHDIELIKECIDRIDSALWVDADRKIAVGTLSIVKDKLTEVYFNLGGENVWA